MHNVSIMTTRDMSKRRIEAELDKRAKILEELGLFCLVKRKE